MNFYGKIRKYLGCDGLSVKSEFSLTERSGDVFTIMLSPGLQIGGEQFPELESCVAEMCFDGAFGTFHTGCDGFDRHFMNIV